jgi:predicted DCC family thiol-disulfide oxidoreductase YuxK
MDSILVFDGSCALCNRCVQFLLRHEAAPLLRFASLQSRAGIGLLRAHGLDPGQTLVLIADGRAYVKSAALIRVSRYLSGPWRFLGAIRILPERLRDWGYDVVARNRRHGSGGRCPLPPLEARERFLDD